jgi:putative sulphur oxygenase reductase
MAELDIRQPESNIYSNVEDSEALPLFVRYTSDDAKFHDKDALVSFEDTIAQLSGTHTCSFIHRRQKGRNKVYEELAIKFDDLPYCMTAQLARDEYTLRAPHFTVKNMVLPEEKDQFVIRKCEVRFVDLYEDSFKLISGAGPYWIGHVNEITQFMKDCFSLPIPPIEIQIEEDKEMWQAYLDGLNALLENKRDLIKIQNISKQKGGLLKLDFDMDSYAQNLNNAITEELKGKCEMEAKVSIDDGECLISFDSYQSIPEDTIENIKTIGRDYCYQADSEPTNTVSGKIAIISDSEELADITSSIDSELTEFGVDLKKNESGEFLLTSDKDIVFLQKIVDTHHKGIAEVVCTTKLIMPLLPSVESVDINSYCKDLPDDAQVIPHGKHFVITSKRPLDTELSIFSKLRFASCMVSVSPKQIDTSIEIEGANIKSNAYTWIVNNPSELPRLGRYFNMVRKNYSNQYVSSTFHYAFAPQIEKSVLADLKLQNYGKPSLQVDVPRSCVVFYPKSQEDYTTLKEDIFSQLDDSICAEAPEYEPTARIEFLSENEEYRRSVFEKVNVALADKRSNFTTNRLSKDAKELSFAFNFVDIDERDNIETIIEGALASIHGIKIIYEDNNNKGVTQWSLSEDLSLLQELDRKLQSDFRNENVNYINGSKYDKLSEVDEEELAHSQYSKESIIRRRRRQYLQKNSLNIGNCVRRTRDYAIIEPSEDILELLSSKELKIVAGDYIQFPAMGETMELMRQSKAMNRILKPESKYNHRPINPNLPNFIFDPKYAGETVVDLNAAMEDIRSHKIGNLNDRQLEAVTKSVLAKDLALIQGPPGTGKTTVIAEIIWQEIRKNSDCRILLTSQTNLAVDNALERLQGQSGIRPVRIGKPDKLEPEGRRFSLPVMDSWANDSKNCDDNATRIWIDRIV